MKLASLYLDDIVVIPGGKDTGSASGLQDLREASFQASDGWDLRETLPGVFSVHREGMPEPVTVGGYGYSYVRATSGSSDGRAVDGSGPATSADAGSIPAPTTRKGKR